jgi:hypothetical protein
MAKISTYSFPATPSASDYVIGTDTNDSLATKNFMISDIIALAGSTYVPYTGATQDVDLGGFSLYTTSLYMNGGSFYDGNGLPGSSGQVLTSQGPGVSPLWDNISSLLPANKYGYFYDTTTQTCASGGIAAMKYNTPVQTNGVTIVNNGSGFPTRITFAYDGVYNIQFSAQLYRTSGGSPKQVTIWLRKNGTDVADSATHISVQANANYLLASWNFFEAFNAGQYAEIMWSQDDAIDIAYAGPDVVIPHPAVPSVILTVSKIS